MPRSYLTTLKFASAVREACFREPYNIETFRQDVLAGLTVGLIAIPLSMALAIASGVPPQNGLYTAIFAGFVIALTGGSRLSISGPTAAFVVILYPVSMKFGLGGLLLATVMAGVILLAMAVLRLGRFIEYIPEPVTLGFTSGIAVVIATLQLNDFIGLGIEALPEHFLGKITLIASRLPDLYLPNLLVAAVTLMTLLVWPRLRIPVPGHLPAVLIGVVAALALASCGYHVDTIGSRFSYVLADGSVGQGIPPVFPEFIWPWQAAGADGEPLQLSWSLFEALLPAAFSIAMLGAIESLLCAVVLDGMTGKRHNANGELMGQGVGNILAPFFGGITATAALARSAANYRAGGKTPVAAMSHALFVLFGLVALAPWLAYVPMPTMAALLLMVAWNMSEAHKVVGLCKKAPLSDILVLLVCIALTVLFDMVIAITFGIVVASLLFMREMSRMTRVSDISGSRKQCPDGVPADWVVIKVNGPLFFAAAERIFSEIELLMTGKSGAVLYMDAVSILDAGGLAAMTRFIAHCKAQGQQLIIADLQFQPLKTVAKAKLRPEPDVLRFTATLEEALQSLLDSNVVRPEAQVS
ncbi:MFS superfamily SulP family transporter [Oleiphilus messinensis]|uniref:MFS superfamily SulP family transporter n=1 Tax=Oleiphilus messinensis TaxID=141451 RepID=A0A1Y0IDQ3_9GAMM|nr:C4-dicarboxylic acid transporter DauA [Oleiphilus messinensis]ARU58658.1 MFS superfamily SulP family transporter [Oleiphilus messinensis]